MIGIILIIALFSLFVSNGLAQETASAQIPYLGIPYYLITIIAIVLILPVIIDQYHSYRYAKAPGQGQPIKGTPAPMSGLYRALMTFGIILLIGSIVLSLLGMVTSSVLTPLPNTVDSLSKLASQMKTEGIPPNTSSQIMEILENNNNAQITLNTSLIEIIKTVATVLAGAVTTIVGFYFGTKAPTDAKPEGPGPVKPEGPGPGPVKPEGPGPGPVKPEGPGPGPGPMKREGPGPGPMKREGPGPGPEPMKREGPGPGPEPMKREGPGPGPEPMKREGPGPGPEPMKREGLEPGTVSST